MRFCLISIQLKFSGQESPCTDKLDARFAGLNVGGSGLQMQLLDDSCQLKRLQGKAVNAVIQDVDLPAGNLRRQKQRI